MPIRTVAPDKVAYIRVIGSFEGDVNHLIGRVGKVVAVSHESWTDRELVFANVGDGDCVFNKEDVEYITKKEYFKGCLGG